MLVLGIVLFGVAERIAFTRQERQAPPVTAEQVAIQKAEAPKINAAVEMFHQAKAGDILEMNGKLYLFIREQIPGYYVFWEPGFSSVREFPVNQLIGDSVELRTPNDLIYDDDAREWLRRHAEAGNKP